eukprot:s3211_g7.t1
MLAVHKDRRLRQGTLPAGLLELQGEYQRLALPGSPKVLELLVRLRQHALWAALPLSELQRECRQLGADVTSHDEAVRRLAMSWDPCSEEMPDFWKTQEGKEAVGPKPSAALQRVARHFQTLGLPATATPEDLKRAYRRLVLQYHPDKNRAEISAELANEKFREISEAHVGADMLIFRCDGLFFREVVRPVGSQGWEAAALVQEFEV